MTTPRTPTLFLGHGSPMNAIEENDLHRGWRDAAHSLAKPRAILCISAHWETRGISVTASEHPETIHDFGGFPQALFDVQYRAPGDPALAQRVADLLAPERVRLDPARGLDHGSWGVLRAMWPDADVPVVQLSLDATRPARGHYDLGKRLVPLRDEGVLIVGSGDFVHNLRAFRWDDPRPAPWALTFNDACKRAVLAGDHEALINFEKLTPDARLSVPTNEHFLPILYVLATQAPGEPAAIFNDVVQSSISMTSVRIG